MGMKNKKNIVQYDDLKVGETYRAILAGDEDKVDVICICTNINPGVKRLKDIYLQR